MKFHVCCLTFVCPSSAVGGAVGGLVTEGGIAGARMQSFLLTTLSS